MGWKAKIQHRADSHARYLLTAPPLDPDWVDDMTAQLLERGYLPADAAQIIATRTPRRVEKFLLAGRTPGSSTIPRHSSSSYLGYGLCRFCGGDKLHGECTCGEDDFGDESDER
jgi:hypothetical protein